MLSYFLRTQVVIQEPPRTYTGLRGAAGLMAHGRLLHCAVGFYFPLYPFFVVYSFNQSLNNNSMFTLKYYRVQIQ